MPKRLSRIETPAFSPRIIGTGGTQVKFVSYTKKDSWCQISRFIPLCNDLAFKITLSHLTSRVLPQNDRKKNSLKKQWTISFNDIFCLTAPGLLALGLYLLEQLSWGWSPAATISR